MRNHFTEFTTLLKILPLQDQIKEIEDKIIQVKNEKCEKPLTSHGYRVIKELKHMKQIALNSLNGTNIILQQ